MTYNFVRKKTLLTFWPISTKNSKIVGAQKVPKTFGSARNLILPYCPLDPPSIGPPDPPPAVTQSSS